MHVVQMRPEETNNSLLWCHIHMICVVETGWNLINVWADIQILRRININQFNMEIVILLEGYIYVWQLLPVWYPQITSACFVLHTLL